MSEELPSIVEEETVFFNEQVPLVHMPTIATLEYSKLEPGYRNVSLITTTIFFMIFAAISFGTGYTDNEFLSNNQLLLLAIVGIIYLLFMVMTYMSYTKKSYAIRERDLIYNKGLIWRSSTVIPFNRVQHCEINQGPIERLFGLSELKVFTAGGASSDMSIPGLLPDTAERLKEFIVYKTGSDEEE